MTFFTLDGFVLSFKFEIGLIVVKTFFFNLQPILCGMTNGAVESETLAMRGFGSLNPG